MKSEMHLKRIISRNELKILQTTNPLILIKDIFKSWVIIILSIFLSFSIQDPHFDFFISIVIGTQFYSLLIIAHDGLHRNFFKAVWLNDLWNDFFLLGLFGAVTRVNRLNHINHHLNLSTDSDPDRYKYETKGRKSKINFLYHLTCLPIILNSFWNIYIVPLKIKLSRSSYLSPKKRKKFPNKLSYNLRDITILIIWQAIIIFSLLNLFGIRGYFLFYIIPLVYASICDSLRVFCEHSRTTTDSEANKSNRLTSVYPNFLEKIFFSPHSMNFHAAHHLWPSIPYYNLQEADKLLRIRLVNNKTKVVLEKSYLGIIIKFFKYAN